jgi:phosphoribosylformylglycinamidine synthase
LQGIDGIALPIRHGEGKLICGSPRIRARIQNEALNCLSYTDNKGNITSEYPANPNGSELNCAGICDKTGQIFGLMPHPEAYLSLYNHPDWARKRRLDPLINEAGEGLQIFQNIVRHLQT